MWPGYMCSFLFFLLVGYFRQLCTKRQESQRLEGRPAELQQGQAGPLQSKQPKQIRRRLGLGSPPCGPGTLDCCRCVLGGGVLTAGPISATAQLRTGGRRPGTRVSSGLPARHRGTFPVSIALRLLVTATPTGSLSEGLHLGTFSNLGCQQLPSWPLLLGKSALNPDPSWPPLGRSRCVRSWTCDGTGSGTRSAPRPPQFPPRGPAPRPAPPAVGPSPGWPCPVR